MLLDEIDNAAGKHYDNLQNSASQVGLRINKDKTKIMHINYHREGAPPKAPEGLKVVEDFNILGSEEPHLCQTFVEPFGDPLAYLYT